MPRPQVINRGGVCFFRGSHRGGVLTYAMCNTNHGLSELSEGMLPRIYTLFVMVHLSPQSVLTRLRVSRFSSFRRT